MKLNDLGSVDEIYSPFYGEDVDLSLRAWRLGYECYFEPRAICKHPSSTTIKKIKKSKVKIAAKRNKMLLHFIHLSGLSLVVYLFILTIKVPFRLLILDFNYVQAFIQFLGKLRKATDSKQALFQLQQSRNTFFPLMNIKSKIIEKIDELRIQKF
ncbi:unnamed protein product [Chrysoparadoxa australica]